MTTMNSQEPHSTILKSLPTVTIAICWLLNEVGANMPLLIRHILQNTVFNLGWGQLMNGSLTLHCTTPDHIDLLKIQMYFVVVKLGNISVVLAPTIETIDIPVC